ncbi:hypothetical protein GCM10009734_83050 [Nonomuraea bangladeshensis]
MVAPGGGLSGGEDAEAVVPEGVPAVAAATVQASCPPLDVPYVPDKIIELRPAEQVNNPR